MYSHWHLLGFGLALMLLGFVFGTNIGIAMAITEGPQQACHRLPISILDCEKSGQ